MRLNTTIGCLLALAAASPAAMAQYDAAYVKQLEGKTAQMKQCAAIAAQLAAIPLPPKHSDARAVAASHALMKNPGPPPVDPAFVQFEANVKRMDQDLMRCGDALFAGLAPLEAKIPAFLAQMKIAKLTDADKKAISLALTGYHQGKQNLHIAVLGLSKDPEVQSYVAKTLTEHFLNQKY